MTREADVLVRGENNSDTNDADSTSIVFFIHTPKDPATAVFSNVTRRAKHLTEKGHPTRIVAPEDFSWLTHIGRRWYTLLYAWFVAAYIVHRRSTINVVIFHSHAGWLFHLIRPIFKELRVIRTITQFHGLEPLFFAQLSREDTPLSLRYRLMQGFVGNWLIRASCRRSDQIHCLNSEEQRFLVSEKWAIPERVVKYANGVGTEFFLGRDYRRSVRRLLFLGQWIERKGTRALAEAFRLTREGHLDVELWCVGTLCDAKKVLEAFPNNLHDFIHVVPRASRSEIQDHLTSSDIFVLPTQFEGFSMALVEAMASGLPIITTPVSAAPDLLVDRKSALFVPTNAPGRLADGIETLVKDENLRKLIGSNAQIVARQYTWDQVCLKYTELILSVSRDRTG